MDLWAGTFALTNSPIETLPDGGVRISTPLQVFEPIYQQLTEGDTGDPPDPGTVESGTLELGNPSWMPSHYAQYLNDYSREKSLDLDKPSTYQLPNPALPSFGGQKEGAAPLPVVETSPLPELNESGTIQLEASHIGPINILPPENPAAVSESLFWGMEYGSNHAKNPREIDCSTMLVELNTALLGETPIGAQEGINIYNFGLPGEDTATAYVRVSNEVMTTERYARSSDDLIRPLPPTSGIVGVMEERGWGRRVPVTDVAPGHVLQLQREAPRGFQGHAGVVRGIRRTDSGVVVTLFGAHNPEDGVGLKDFNLSEWQMYYFGAYNESVLENYRIRNANELMLDRGWVIRGQ